MNKNTENLNSVGTNVHIHDTAIITRPHLIDIGNNVSIDAFVYFSTGAKLGSYIHIAPSVSIIGGADAMLIMEDYTNISAGSRIICASDDFKQGMISPLVPIEYRTVINKPIVFKKYVVIGTNCVVAPGVILAEGSVIAANSFISKNTEPWTIYGGSPARPIGTRSKDRILETAEILNLNCK